MLDSLLSRAVRAALAVLDAGRRGRDPTAGRWGCGYGGCGPRGVADIKLDGRRLGFLSREGPCFVLFDHYPLPTPGPSGVLNGRRAHLELNPLELAEVEKKAVPPKSEECSKAESQQKPQESQQLQSQLPSEQGPPPLTVQLGLLRAETDR